MYVARILYPVKVLGPGDRIGIWLCGCKHNCKGCSNPELWNFQDKYKISLDNVMRLIEKISTENQVDGFTITGGDPFMQYNDLHLLMQRLLSVSDDILVYTGYTIDEIENKNINGITVLIDGRYEEKLNDNTLLRGSSNQQIHILQEKYREKYENYLETATNQIQNFSLNDGTVSVGIHRKGF